MPQTPHPYFMLIQPDKAQLGDANLDLKEGIAKAREDTARKTAAYKIPDQALLENREMARGRTMDWAEFIRRVNKLNPKILFEKGGVSNAVAVRVLRKNAAGEEEKNYVSGFYMEPMPEFSSVTVDKHGLPVREVRGWRAVLLALIRAEVLTERQVELTFGPAMGQRAVLWDRSMHAHR